MMRCRTHETSTNTPMTRHSRMQPLVAILALTLGIPCAHELNAQATDEAEIRRVIADYYLEGRRQADSTVLGRAFLLGNAHMFYVRDDTLADVPIPTYVNRIASARNDPTWKAGERSKARITLIDITGNAAMAKVEDIGSDATVVDYMILMKVRGHWKIASKAFDRTALTR